MYQREEEPYQDDDKDPVITGNQISKKLDINEETALQDVEVVQIIEEDIIMLEDEDAEMEEGSDEEKEGEVGGMSRGRSMSMLSFSTSSTLGNRERMIGSMSLIVEEEEEEEDSDDYEEGEILVISDSEDSEEVGEESEVEVVEVKTEEENDQEEVMKVEVPVEEPRQLSVGRFFPPRPPREMTYAEFRSAAIEAEWQEALSHAMRIPEF